MSWPKKSLHVQMKVKIAVVASAGTMRGMSTCRKMRRWPAPSMRAASSSSFGSERMNCTMRNTKKASVARNFGTSSGRNVLTHPSWEKITYWGTMMTWIGSMIVASMIAKNTVRPRNCNLAKA